MTPRPPSDLAAGGRALWRSVLGEFDLSPGELRVLTEACRTVDELDRMRRALADAELTVDGSRGQPVANPLAGEIRRHRETLAKLIAGLQEDR